MTLKRIGVLKIMDLIKHFYNLGWRDSDLELHVRYNFYLFTASGTMVLIGHSLAFLWLKWVDYMEMILCFCFFAKYYLVKTFLLWYKKEVLYVGVCVCLCVCRMQQK